MSASSYLKDLSAKLGLCYVPKAKPFDSKKDPIPAIRYAAGSIIGERAGFLTVLSLISSGHDTQLCILIRYPKVSDVDTLAVAIQDAFRVTKLQLSKKANVGDRSVTLNWRYALKKPGKEDVARAVDEVISVIGTHVQPFTGRCEECGQASDEGIMLLNDLPCYMCRPCQRRISEDKQREAEEYSQREMGFAHAFVLATGAALLCAFALSWIYFGTSDNGQIPIKLALIAPILIGLAAGLVFAKNVTRIDIWKQGAPLFLLCFSLSFCSMVGYLLIARSHQGHVQNILGTYIHLAKLWTRFHLRGNGLLFVLGYLLSGICCVGLVKEHTPKFGRSFIPLSQASTLA